MTRPLHAMFAARDLRASPFLAVQTIIAARIATLYVRAERDPLPDMAVRLRSMRAAQALMALTETITESWPDSFLVHRPCCMALSPDEALLCDVAAAVLRGDRRRAMDAMSDLLPGMARERLFRDMVELVDAMRVAQTAQVTNEAGLSSPN